ncbi:MAG TPA: DNA polymerase [Candidatus Paceibacterota bacterium]
MALSNKESLVLLDAHAILHRAFHALPGFTSPKGEGTGALYGFASFILKVIRELKPNYIAACYDLPGPTFRHDAYEGYKAKRPKIDESLISQINKSREILKAFNIPVYDSPGFEADDILGTIVEQLKKTKVKTLIASGDMDTLQLVRGDEVVVYTLKKGIQDTIIYNEEGVIARYGFKPEYIPDFKGLKGDPSDNIIGVPGIGEKTAKEIIQKFGPIESLYKSLKGKDDKSPLKPRVAELLINHEEEALFSKSLATIRTDAPIEFSLSGARWRDGIDKAEAEKIFGELGFKSLISRLKNGLVGNEAEAPAQREVEVLTPNEVEAENKIREKFANSVPDKLLKEVEIPLIKILGEMKERGVLIDTPYLKELSVDYHKRIKKLERKIWDLAGEEFNINSPKQLGVVLFETLALEARGLRMTATGNYGTNISQLEKLKGTHPIIGEIISHRELAKLLSTYIDAFPKMVDGEGRLHTTFDSAGASTGRISSSDPNLQNIPARTELGMNIRRAFISPRGAKLLALDYSQIELRILAILSRDEKLSAIFKRGEDVHTAVASEVFNVSSRDVTPEMRRRAKVINFGIIYGMGVNALKNSIGSSQKEAREFYDNYFIRFPKISGYLEGLKKEAYEKGYTETFFGRKRYFPDIRSRVEYVRKSAERMAMNAPIQGSAADFIKLAMVNAEEALRKKGLKEKASLLLQIHDELVYEVKNEALEDVARVVSHEMEHVWDGGVPIVVHVSAGNNLADLKDLKL